MYQETLLHNLKVCPIIDFFPLLKEKQKKQDSHGRHIYI